ncbi:MAG: hypothetical protein ACI841_002170 [Planctomycetota bacterium]|jgi:hypothetical protein
MRPSLSCTSRKLGDPQIATLDEMCALFLEEDTARVVLRETLLALYDRPSIAERILGLERRERLFALIALIRKGAP